MCVGKIILCFSSNHRCWFKYVAGIGIYCPLSFFHCSVCLCHSRAININWSVSFGDFIFLQALMAAPLPCLRGYEVHKSSNSVSDTDSDTDTDTDTALLQDFLVLFSVPFFVPFLYFLSL